MGSHLAKWDGVGATAWPGAPALSCRVSWGFTADHSASFVHGGLSWLPAESKMGTPGRGQRARGGWGRIWLHVLGKQPVPEVSALEKPMLGVAAPSSGPHPAVPASLTEGPPPPRSPPGLLPDSVVSPGVGSWYQAEPPRPLLSGSECVVGEVGASQKPSPAPSPLPPPPARVLTPATTSAGAQFPVCGHLERVTPLSAARPGICMRDTFLPGQAGAGRPRTGRLAPARGRICMRVFLGLQVGREEVVEALGSPPMRREPLFPSCSVSSWSPLESSLGEAELTAASRAERPGRLWEEPEQA